MQVHMIQMLTAAMVICTTDTLPVMARTAAGLTRQSSNGKDTQAVVIESTGDVFDVQHTGMSTAHNNIHAHYHQTTTTASMSPICSDYCGAEFTTKAAASQCSNKSFWEPVEDKLDTTPRRRSARCLHPSTKNGKLDIGYINGQHQEEGPGARQKMCNCMEEFMTNGKSLICDLCGCPAVCRDFKEQLGCEELYNRVDGACHMEQACWSKRLDGKYVREGHTETDECYELEVAVKKCEEATDCFAIATQSNVCGGRYRVTHGGPTFKSYANWEPYKLWSYKLDRECLKKEKFKGSDEDVYRHWAKLMKKMAFPSRTRAR